MRTKQEDLAIKKIILFGGGDLAIEVATYISDINNDLSETSDQGLGRNWRATDVISSEPAREEQLSEVIGVCPNFHLGTETVQDCSEKHIIICVGDPSTRHQIYKDLRRSGMKFATLIHPLAYVSKTAVIGDGTIICPFVFVGPFAQINENCVLNVYSSAGHDVEIGISSVFSPHAMANGHARTGSAAFLGGGSIMHPKTSLGAFGQLSAGSVLTKAAGDGFLMHGNPASGRQMTKVN